MYECKFAVDGICSSCIHPEQCEMFTSTDEMEEPETEDLDNSTPAFILNQAGTERGL